MAGAQISTSVTIIDSLHGFMGLSLTEYSTSAAAAIAAGSVVEIAGAMFTFASDETINASSWTAITTATTAYIALTPSGTAGSQVVTAAYTATAPTWRDDLQGWYASAASSTRVIGTVYKAEATSYYPKYLYGSMQDGKQYNINCNTVSAYSYVSAGRIEPTVFLQGTYTEGSIYSAISSYIPVTGNSAIVSGAVYNLTISALRAISKASRISSTEIYLYYVSDSGTTGVIQIRSGVVTTVGSVTLSL